MNICTYNLESKSKSSSLYKNITRVSFSYSSIIIIEYSQSIPLGWKNFVLVFIYFFLSNLFIRLFIFFVKLKYKINCKTVEGPIWLRLRRGAQWWQRFGPIRSDMTRKSNPSGRKRWPRFRQ